MTLRRLLIVEDDTDIREVLAEDLVARGYTVETAENGAVALEAMRASSVPHDVVVLDLMMPVMDGWDVLREMAKDARLRSLPVIVTTGAHDPRRLPSHVKLFLKPYSVDDLVREIERRSSP